MFALAIIGLLFTLDAALASGVTPSTTLAIIAGAGLLGRYVVHLTRLVLSGTKRQRQGAIVTMNAIGALPPILVLAAAPTIDPQYRSQIVSATVVWLVIVLLWTTIVLETLAHRASSDASAPSRHGGAAPSGSWAEFPGSHTPSHAPHASAHAGPA